MSGKRDQRILAAELEVTCLMPPSAAARWMTRPVGTEPVKAIRLTAGCRASASPAGHAQAGDDIDDAGRQHLAADFAQHGGRQRLVSGGLSTTVLPANQRRRQRIAANLMG